MRYWYRRSLVDYADGSLISQPDGSSSYANPYDNETDANVVVIIAGNPKGIYSAHHEKLVLIDAECPPHTVAFTGVRAHVPRWASTTHS
jgi:hypothetical protein